MHEILASINPLYSFAGLAVGLLVGLTGVGGGSLMTPVLVLLFGIHPAVAVGTDLLYAGLTKIGGSVVHARNRSVDWRIVGLLASGSVPASLVVIGLLAHFGRASATFSALITVVLGFALILTAAVLFLHRWLLADLAVRLEGFNGRNSTVLTVSLGVILGVLVSISSVGAGAIGGAALVLLFPKLPTSKVVGSDIAHAVPLTLVAGAGYWWLGAIDWPLLASLLIGSLPGVAIGSHFSARMPNKILRPILAATLMLVGAKLAL